MLWYALAFLDFNCFCSGVKVRLFIAFALAFALAFGSGLLLLLGSPVAGVPGSSVAGVLGSSVGGVLLAAAFAFALAFAFGSPPLFVFLALVLVQFRPTCFSVSFPYACFLVNPRVHQLQPNVHSQVEGQEPWINTTCPYTCCKPKQKHIRPCMHASMQET